VIGVQIAAPPSDGEANNELREYFASILDLKKRQVNIQFGGKSRNKVISVTDITVEEVYEKIKKEFNG